MAKSRRIYYTMGQICEMFDLPASTIRFWESKFKILDPRKNAKGNRLFTPADLENLKLIYHLVKEKKMTLKGAETYLMQRKVAARSEMTMVEILQKIRTTLLEIRQEIDSQEEVAKQNQQEEEAMEFIIQGEQIEDEETLFANIVEDEEEMDKAEIAKIKELVDSTENADEQDNGNDDPRITQLTLF